VKIFLLDPARTGYFFLLKAGYGERISR